MLKHPWFPRLDCIKYIHDMSAQILNLYVDKNTDWVLEAQLIGVNQKPVDIDGVKFQAIAVDKEQRNPSFVIDCDIKFSTNGVILLHLPYERTKKIRPGEYEFNVECTIKTGRRFRILQGSLFMSADLTPDIIW